MGRGQRGQQLLDLVEPVPGGVALPLLPGGQAQLDVEGLAGPVGERGDVQGAVGEPAERAGPAPGRAPELVPAVQRGPRVGGEQEGDDGGEGLRGAPVLLAGQPARLVAAVGQFGPGPGQLLLRPGHRRALQAQLRVGDVVRPGGLLGGPVEGAQPAEQRADGLAGRRVGVHAGVRGGQGDGGGQQYGAQAAHQPS
ncbi:hypothetical protein GCM10020221_02260 [Streptomyces thioluteus]|uniref:Uncharacterized protein n=1 Tax=Streptomyces thioluteus TaxID=66431 RepID=A0ABN3WBV6_STRTU